MRKKSVEMNFKIEKTCTCCPKPLELSKLIQVSNELTKIFQPNLSDRPRTSPRASALHVNQNSHENDRECCDDELKQQFVES